jgi:signal transduction histidine kinase
MNESLDMNFAKFIERNAEALKKMASESSANFSMLWAVLVYIFDLNCLYIYQTDDGENFQKNIAFTRDLIGEEPGHDNLKKLMRSAFEENKAKSIQTEEILGDDIYRIVEATAAIPLVIDNIQKVLIIYKRLFKPKDEVVGGYVFDSYRLELYLSVIRVFIRVHEQERQIIQSGKLAELGTLTAGIAHEINNPLNTIITKLAMLQDYVHDFKKFLIEFKEDNRLLLDKTKRIKIDFIIERLEKNIQLPLEMAERVRTTVQSLKRFAAVDTGDKELVNANHLIDEALEIVWNKVKHKAVVTKNYDQNLKPIKTLRNRLSQVLVNILDNAAEAIVDYGNIRINTRQENRDIVIEIINDGVVISKENLKRLFTPYFTTKEGGLGLGLYLSHRIINDLSGNIMAESEEDKGTTFTIRLPL